MESHVSGALMNQGGGGVNQIKAVLKRHFIKRVVSKKFVNYKSFLEKVKKIKGARGNDQASALIDE